MKYKYISKERKYLYGRWYNPDEIIENDRIPNETDFEEVKSTSKKHKGE
jgi:hypothetical protein